MKFISVLAVIFIVLGIIERHKHKKNLSKIPYIIHINGIRGKSSTTRLTAGALRHAGFKVLAKITGSAARIIFSDGSEQEIIRHGPPSISEQKKIVQLAVKENVDVLVIECMAISPEIQWSSENLFLNADYMVITNIRNDHLDKMGSSLTEIADTICLSLPYNAHVVSSEYHLYSFIKEKAEMRNNQFISTRDIIFSEDELKKFDKQVFSDNAACALKIARHFGIDRKTALNGMYTASEDPGSLKYYHLEEKMRNIVFVKAFAANDRDSTEIIWKRTAEKIKKFSVDNPQVFALISHRSDRAFRLKEFADFLTVENRFDGYILSGALKFRQKRLLKKRTKQKKPILKLHLFNTFYTYRHLSAFFSKVKEDKDIIIFGCGNIHGDAEIISEFFEKYGVELK
ncbi:poly-gamma-glutamate synthase PgsB [Halanaerobium sp. MA284_MarDTE_T2]|uniref:poly-gamma-glutamate synthase PgsB n=1 Tax=Halanaerobium sp. MA284_MarDTE_T2 TaxID=2183913 RepID=UPI000DF352DD|nr:poly-gamma-glutamate synthase PgsB [Halanaerobium sp. MA284_MarDTE_T2]RCW49846.1 poly-gamma-glutamate synthase PgsB/CapB [Halanaerobium sp. MA284_MarDTE_T2]